MPKLSDEKIPTVRKKNGKKIVMGFSIESAVNSQNGLTRRNTFLICGTRKIIRAKFNFKQQFDNIS